MSEDAQPPVFAFPPALVSRVDLARLVREVEAVDNELEAQKVRSPDHAHAEYSLPNMSQSLTDFLELNKVQIADDHTRMGLKEQLQKLKDHAPIIHMTFACEADPESLAQLVGWIRQNLHPQALVSVGLQPSLIGGVYIRTPNHVHDFSLRAHLKSKRGLVLKQLEELI